MPPAELSSMNNPDTVFTLEAGKHRDVILPNGQVIKIIGTNDGFSTETRVLQDTRSLSEISALDKPKLVVENYTDGNGILLPNGVDVKAIED